MNKIFLVLITLVLSDAGSFLLKAGDPLVKPVVINERVCVNTDRKIYIAGENLLYSYYLIDKLTGMLATHPSIGYVMLTDIHGKIIGKSQVKVENGLANGFINISDTIQSGYYQLVAYTNYMRNGFYDNYFRSQVIIANRFDKDLFGLIKGNNQDSTSVQETNLNDVNSHKINIVPLKAECSRREKNGFSISISDPTIQFADLTISVVEKNSPEKDLTTRIPHLAYVKFKKGMKQNDRPVYLAEDKFPELMGLLTSAENGDGVGYHLMFLTSPDTVANFEYAITDAKGYFRFPLKDYYNGKDLFIKLRQNEGEDISPVITIESKFDDNLPFEPQPWTLDSLDVKYIKNSQDLVRIQKSYLQISRQPQAISYKFGIPYFYRKPDLNVKPSDYVDLKDFNEISHEILGPVKVRMHNKVYEVEIMDVMNSRYLGKDPIILLDGVMIDDINQIIPYGTRDIRKVDIISTKWVVDFQEFNGLLSVFTYNNLWKNISLNKNNLRVKSENYYEPPVVFGPTYSDGNLHSREPDFRQILYWNPNIRLKNQESRTVNFFTSDYTGSYLIKVKGITESGEVVEGYGEFNVNE